MDNVWYNFNFEVLCKYLMYYHKNGCEEDFNKFVRNGGRQFIIFIARKKFERFKKELVKDLEQEAANIVLIRLMKPRKTPITSDAIELKNYLYTAAINVSYDLIKKYKLYENESITPFENQAYRIKSPEYKTICEEAMKIIYDKLLHYFTQEMKPKVMNPYQAYVFIETIKGYSCKEIVKTMSGRKFETIKSDLRGARKLIRSNCVSRAKIMEILESSVI